MALFSPSVLKTAVNAKGGFAFNNRYSVTFTPPSAIGLDVNVPRRLSFLCDNVTIPTRSLATTEKSIYGPVFQVPYRSTYVESAMNFILTDSMEEKKFFDNWQNYIIDPKRGNLNYSSTYVCNINIKKFSSGATDENSTPTYEVTLIDAWPSIVGEVGLTHSGGNDIVRLPVTFQYKKWLYGNPSTTSSSSVVADSPDVG